MKRRAILLAVLITLIYSTYTPALTFYIWKDKNDIVHIEDVRPEGTTKCEKIEIDEYSIDPSSSESTGRGDDDADKTTPRKKEGREEKNFIRSFAEDFIEFFRIPEREKGKDNLTSTQRSLDKYLKADTASPEEKKE